MERPNSRWQRMVEGDYAARYAARFERLAASGADIHGEARFCAARLAAHSRVLDAGCGTGRVAIRLAEEGHTCVGVDIDDAMLAEAHRNAPELTWLRADLAEVSSLGLTPDFDMVVAAGNVMPLLAPGSEARAVNELAALLAPSGLLVAGFGLDAHHLPLDAAPFGTAEYDSWCAAAGLTLQRRYATWDGDPYTGGGYAVSVHSRQGDVPGGR